MDPKKQRILFMLTALVIGVSVPYLLDMSGHALEPQLATAALVPVDELSVSQRLELACATLQQMNNKLNRLDPNRPSFLGDLKQYQKVRPELQDIHRLVCGR
jgi:hypothetical protein